MTKKPLLLALLTTPLAIQAQSIEPVVISANQITQSQDEITADHYLIDTQTLKAKHYTSLIDALREVPGISFTRNGGLGTTTNVYLRGSNNARLLILLDGVRLNDPSSSNGANLASISLANIERIEVIKGAQSGVWGADAAAGVIHLISKDSAGQSITLEAGSYGTTRAGFNGQWALGEHKLTLGAEQLNSDGFSAQAPAYSDIDQYEDDGIEQTTLNAKLDFKIDPEQHLTISHHHTDTLNNYDGYQAPDSQQRTDSQTALSSINWHNKHTEIRLEQSDFRSEQLDSPSTDLVNGLTQAFHLKHQVNQLVLGVDYSRNQVQSDKYSWSAGSNIQLEGETTSKGAFASFSHSLDQWHFNESLRIDDYSNFDSQVTGKLGAKYQIAEEHALSFNIGQAYNAPSIIQMLNPWGSANFALKPETSIEASLSYQWHGLNASYFDKQVEDLIEWRSGQYQNINGRTHIKGYELGWQQQLNTLDYRVSYTHLQTEDAQGKELPRRPQDQIGVDLTWFASHQWDINLNGQYIGERSEGLATQYYAVFNSVVNYQATPKTRIYLKVDNLFDRYYQVVNGYATAERSAYLGLNYQF